MIPDTLKIIAQKKAGVGTMWFYYDANGKRLGFSDYNGYAYYYIYNAMGDVIGLYDQYGDVIYYHYDTWGKLVSITNVLGEEITYGMAKWTIAQENPFRYRGYMYDNNTQLYYLNSRYYDPETGRFVNSDAQINAHLLGANLYTYCYNNPVNLVDTIGFQPEWASVISRYAKGTVAYDLMVHATQQGWFSEIFYAAGFVRDSGGIYHARQDCLQQYGGYNDVYDFAFDLGTDMVSVKFPFSYNGTEYILWAWKGDYLNLGAGAELGIYYGGGPHWFVDTSLAQPMALWLDYNGANIITYIPDEYTWWITGFNPYYQNVKANELTATYAIRFLDYGMYAAFRAQYSQDTRWTFFMMQGFGKAVLTF